MVILFIFIISLITITLTVRPILERSWQRSLDEGDYVKIRLDDDDFYGEVVSRDGDEVILHLDEPHNGYDNTRVSIYVCHISIKC
jgi:hypothetical protein